MRGIDAAGQTCPGHEGTDPVSTPPVADRRRAGRVTLLVRAAKLIADGHEFLCVIRDASATGLKARIFHPIPNTGKFQVETSDGQRYPVKLMWCANGHAGFRFVEDIDVHSLISDRNGHSARRQLRLDIATQAHIQSGSKSHEATLRNISQQGACIECDRQLLIGEAVRIDTGFMQPIIAKVRWRRKPLYGLVFEQTFRLDELAVLLGSQNGGGKKANSA